MVWLICFVLGLICGAGCTIGAIWSRVAAAKQLRAEADLRLLDANRKRDELVGREKVVNTQESELAVAREEFRQRATKVIEEAESKISGEREAHEQRMQRERGELETEVRAFRARTIAYEDLEKENSILKRDLQNIDVTLNKRTMDGELLKQQQFAFDERSKALATRYLADTTKWISQSLNPNNYAAQKDRLVDAINRVRGIGFNITADEEALRIAELKQQYETVVKIALQREEQARIKAQIREEERVQREAERAMEQARRDSELVQAALDKALADAHGQHSVEVEALKQQLAEAEAKSVRALSMAQQTKAGNIYVISNPGSFGDNVFKIGMTRRLEPLDRIRELGDASVPFAFDVHMMISCTDAPALENALHRALHKNRLNKVNPRKEFFRSDIQTIVNVVEKHHGKVEYVADAEAFEYRESLRMSDEDAAFVEQVFEEAEEAGQVVTED